MKFLRIFRLVRVYRLMQDIGVPRWSDPDPRAGRQRAAPLLLMGILVLQFGSLEILYLEKYAPGANITDARMRSGTPS